jgi:hypothetical protein
VKPKQKSNRTKTMETTKKLKRQQRRDDDNGFADHGGYMAAKVSKLEEQFLSIQVG